MGFEHQLNNKVRETMNFEIKEAFYFDGKAEKIISGAIHYYRVTRGKWAQSLHNLKAGEL